KSGRLNSKTSIQVDFRTSINARILPRYDVITSPEEYIGISWNSVYNQGVALNNANPVAYANDNLFGGGGINAGYNMWNVANVSELIDPATGMVRPGVTRKYNPERWEDYAFQQAYRQEANVQFNGGTEKTTYSSSFGFLDDK